MKYLDKITSRLKKSPLKINTLKQIIKKYDTFYDNVDLELELLVANGYPLEFVDNVAHLKTNETIISNQTFCIIDIETNASKASNGQIIELGAIKYKDGEIIDQYHTLINANSISTYIQDLTGITLDMLQKAPSLKETMEEFKIFLDDDLFVAHNISFDYKFINDTFEQIDLGKLCNRKLCTIDLSKRLIPSPKYGLQYLLESLNIEQVSHHRAYDDAINTTKIFQQCIQTIPHDVKTAEDLISFSKSDNLLSN